MLPVIFRFVVTRWWVIYLPLLEKIAELYLLSAKSKLDLGLPECVHSVDTVVLARCWHVICAAFGEV